MKHNDSLEKNKYGMLARRHDAINTNKFQSFANTIICIFGRKQFVVQWWTLSRYPRRPAPLLKLYEQQNCADWFIRSMKRLIVGNCCILQLCWPCIRCCSWPLTSHDGNKQWDLRWLGLDCEQQFSASHPVLTQCNPLLPLSLLLSVVWSFEVVHLKVWFLVITRLKRRAHKCPMGPINCWYPQSNLCRLQSGLSQDTIFPCENLPNMEPLSTVNTDIQHNKNRGIPSTNPAQNCTL